MTQLAEPGSKLAAKLDRLGIGASNTMQANPLGAAHWIFIFTSANPTRTLSTL